MDDWTDDPNDAQIRGVTGNDGAAWNDAKRLREKLNPILQNRPASELALAAGTGVGAIGKRLLYLERGLSKQEVPGALRVQLAQMEADRPAQLARYLAENAGPVASVALTPPERPALLPAPRVLRVPQTRLVYVLLALVLLALFLRRR